MCALTEQYFLTTGIAVFQNPLEMTARKLYMKSNKDFF